MPEMDGLMLAARIREIPREPALPLIMLSSLGSNEIGQTDANFLPY